MHEKLALFHTICIKKNCTFVSFRKPHETDIQTMVQHKTEPSKIHSISEIDNVKGFIFAPFNINTSNPAYIIKPEYQFTNNNIKEEWLEELNTRDSIEIQNTTDSNESTKNEYLMAVSNAVHSIKKELFHKVVLSKTQHLHKPEGFSEAELFQKLCTCYPHAYVYFVSINNVCCWIGATPEPLLTTQNNTMQTVSLAGTQIAQDLPIEKHSWSNKELDEQAIVTQFIEQTLKENQIITYHKSDTHNYKAANLIHLKTSFSFPFSKQISISKLVNALHPTPSVGGLPRENAINFILNNEHYNRSFYSGFLGTIDHNLNVQLYVNLRCMQIFKSTIQLYSGAGITRDSVPENEWTETENKLQTLKQVIFSSKI